MEIFAFRLHKLGMLSCTLWWGKAGTAVWLQELGILQYMLIAAKFIRFLHRTHDQLSLFSSHVTKVTQFFHPKMNVIGLDKDK